MEKINENEERIERNEVMLTTVDNPYDYFTQFIEWNEFDVSKGYNTCCYLNRIVEQLGGITEDMTQKEEDLLISQAIDQIFIYNPTSDIYRRISRVVYG